MSIGSEPRDLRKRGSDKRPFAKRWDGCWTACPSPLSNRKRGLGRRCLLRSARSTEASSRPGWLLSCALRLTAAGLRVPRFLKRKLRDRVGRGASLLPSREAPSRSGAFRSRRAAGNGPLGGSGLPSGLPPRRTARRCLPKPRTGGIVASGARRGALGGAFVPAYPRRHSSGRPGDLAEPLAFYTPPWAFTRCTSRSLGCRGAADSATHTSPEGRPSGLSGGSQLVGARASGSTS